MYSIPLIAASKFVIRFIFTRKIQGIVEGSILISGTKIPDKNIFFYQFDSPGIITN